MKITRKQLRQLINETIFAGGPTVGDAYAKGVTVDMGRQSPPLYRPQSARDEEIRRTSDPRIIKMLDSDNPEDQEMARTMASSFDGKPEAYEYLTPEEREGQSLFDEFYPKDVFDPEHDVPDDRLQRSYAPEMQQIKDAMKKRMDAEWDKGNREYDDLFSAAYGTPGYNNLRSHLSKLPSPSYGKGATGFHGDDPGRQLMLMPGQLIDMYMADDNPHY